MLGIIRWQNSVQRFSELLHRPRRNHLTVFWQTMVIDCSPQKNRLLEKRRMFRHPLTSAAAVPIFSIIWEFQQKTKIITYFHSFVTISTVKNDLHVSNSKEQTLSIFCSTQYKHKKICSLRGTHCLHTTGFRLTGLLYFCFQWYLTP